MKKNALIAADLSVIAMLVTACNTIEGIGEDVEATGEAIDQTAEDNGAS